MYLVSKAHSVTTASLMNSAKSLNANKFASVIYQNSHLLGYVYLENFIQRDMIIIAIYN